MACKWIVQGSQFRISNCVEFQSELVSKGSAHEVKGGGYHILRRNEYKLYLYGKSEDLGSVN